MPPAEHTQVSLTSESKPSSTTRRCEGSCEYFNKLLFPSFRGRKRFCLLVHASRLLKTQALSCAHQFARQHKFPLI